MFLAIPLDFLENAPSSSSELEEDPERAMLVRNFGVLLFSSSSSSPKTFEEVVPLETFGLIGRFRFRCGGRFMLKLCFVVEAGTFSFLAGASAALEGVAVNAIVPL